MTRFFNADMKGAISDFDAYLKNNLHESCIIGSEGLLIIMPASLKKESNSLRFIKTLILMMWKMRCGIFFVLTKSKGFEEARKSLIDIKGDGRVPMAQVQLLFAGKLEPKDVIEAANAGNLSLMSCVIDYATPISIWGFITKLWERKNRMNTSLSLPLIIQCPITWGSFTCSYES